MAPGDEESARRGKDPATLTAGHCAPPQARLASPRPLPQHQGVSEAEAPPGQCCGLTSRHSGLLCAEQLSRAEANMMRPRSCMGHLPRTVN